MLTQTSGKLTGQVLEGCSRWIGCCSNICLCIPWCSYSSFEKYNWPISWGMLPLSLLSPKYLWHECECLWWCFLVCSQILQGIWLANLWRNAPTERNVVQISVNEGHSRGWCSFSLLTTSSAHITAQSPEEYWPLLICPWGKRSEQTCQKQKCFACKGLHPEIILYMFRNSNNETVYKCCCALWISFCDDS